MNSKALSEALKPIRLDGFQKCKVIVIASPDIYRDEAIPFLRYKIRLPQSFLTVLLCIFCVTATAQQQLIVLKNEEVLARYQKGDIIKFMRLYDKEIQVQRILDMNDTLLMMNFDSVAYYRLKKLDIRGLKQKPYAPKLGGSMIAAGVLLPLIELLNTGVFQDTDREATVSPGVWITSGALISGGALLAFIKKPYFKPGRKFHLLIVDERSTFYKARPVSDSFTSPLIPDK